VVSTWEQGPERRRGTQYVKGIDPARADFGSGWFIVAVDRMAPAGPVAGRHGHRALEFHALFPNDHGATHQPSADAVFLGYQPVTLVIVVTPKLRQGEGQWLRRAC
jgi:hypothetical protein